MPYFSTFQHLPHLHANDKLAVRAVLLQSAMSCLACDPVTAEFDTERCTRTQVPRPHKTHPAFGHINHPRSFGLERRAIRDRKPHNTVSTPASVSSLSRVGHK